MKYIFKSIVLLAVCYCCNIFQAAGQSYPQADPAVISINKQGPTDPAPTGSNINGAAYLKFRVANNSAGNIANGKVPAGAVFYTVQFNPYYTYESLYPSTQFAVTYSQGAPDYVVQLTNLVDINPGDVFDFYLRVVALQETTTAQGEIVTMNVDRTLPIQCANTQTSNDNVFKYFTVGSLIPLPVKKIDLSAVLLDNNFVDLKWTTLDEYNTSNFQIERSLDGSNFTAIGDKPASGTTVGSTHYLFKDLDNQLISGYSIVYYRIKMVDIDGSFVYTRTVPVKISKSTSFTVWPNPFRDQVNVRVSVEARTGASLQLYNYNGSLVHQQQLTLQTGINFIPVTDLGKLARGAYMMKLVLDNGQVISTKLIKQ